MSDNVIVFYGEDSFYIKTKINQIIKKHEIDAFNTTTYDMDETRLSDAISDAQTIPFMADKKAIIIKNALFLTAAKPKKGALTQTVAYLEEYIKNPTEETLLIISVPYSKLDNKKKIVKQLKEKATVNEMKLKGPNDLSSWAQRQVANSGLSMEPDALKLFVSRVKHSTELAFLEMKKLLLYAQNQSVIDKVMVKKLITKNIEDNVYDITNAIIASQPSKALEVYKDLITYSEDPLRILSIIINKYREMIQVNSLLESSYSQDEIQRYFNVSSGRAYYMVQNAKGVKRDKIEAHLEYLEQLDFNIKSGRIDKKHAVEMFILST